ncbi:MAG: hypothetical protein A2W00_01890 [Candidatus Eisenbacteria bacterium RBG_16_71_46]|nr:MAG: hypothetical protein A2W00_01890 [Candidatus Eisenbacteria bacterium RBG_16_71_46]OGF24698.1 MAG: hypothetical protein A2V63_11005 [Candidatus Eisenbacteria bacterium RBG_19FT_COMBO_70_11]
MMKFMSRPEKSEEIPPPNTIIGLGSSVRGTLMVSGTLRIEGEFEGDILNCERLQIGEHGLMRADIEVRDALILGRVVGNVRALGVLEMRSGARVEGDIAATSVVMEQGVHFSGRCTMLDGGTETLEFGSERTHAREHARG